MLRYTFLPVIIGKMHMTVNEISGMVFLQQTVKTAKPHMREIFSIIDAESGRMGNQYIQSSVAADLALQLHSTEEHLFLCVLKIAGTVFHGTAKPGNPDPLKFKDPAVNTGTALRRGIEITIIVIAVNI